ncbi:MAG: hypothetical protein ACRCYP_06630 [Alphaproteobacteria bacterium]
MKQAIAKQTPKEDPKMPGQMSKFLAKPTKPKKSENKSPASLEAILEKRRSDGYEELWVKGRIS